MTHDLKGYFMSEQFTFSFTEPINPEILQVKYSDIHSDDLNGFVAVPTVPSKVEHHGFKDRRRIDFRIDIELNGFDPFILRIGGLAECHLTMVLADNPVRYDMNISASKQRFRIA